MRGDACIPPHLLIPLPIRRPPSIEPKRSGGELEALRLVCTIMVAALQITFHIYNRHLYEKSQAELDFFAQQVNAKLSQNQELTVSIATGSKVQNQLSRMQEMEYLSPEYNYAKQRLMTILQNKIFSWDIIRNVIYTDQNQVTLMAGICTGELPAYLHIGAFDAESGRGGDIPVLAGMIVPVLLGQMSAMGLKKDLHGALTELLTAWRIAE